MKCTICGKEVILVPSAAARAAKDVSGNTAAYYTSLFPQHSDCMLQRRAAAVSELMSRLRQVRPVTVKYCGKKGNTQNTANE